MRSAAQDFANKQYSASARERTRPAATGSLSYFDSRDATTGLFQKEIHAIEIDDGMTDVQGIHPQNPADSRAALRQGETR